MAQTNEAAPEAEQSFNESELADIMSEIENLEKDFLADASIDSEVQVPEESISVPTPVEEVLEKEFGNKSISLVNPENLKISGQEVKKTNLQELIDQEVKASLEDPALINSSSCQDAKMHFTVAGQMHINLSFVVGGQQVDLAVSEAEGLVIHLAHGAKFTVPFSEVAVKEIKKVA